MSMCYAGRAPCGRLVAAIVDLEQNRSQVAGSVSQWIRAGLVVERVTAEEVRKQFVDCPYPGRACDECDEPHGQMPLPSGRDLVKEASGEERKEEERVT